MITMAMDSISQSNNMIGRFDEELETGHTHSLLQTISPTLNQTEDLLQMLTSECNMHIDNVLICYGINVLVV